MNIISDTKFKKYRNILYKQILNNSVKWSQGLLRGSLRPAGWTIDVREEILTPFYADIIGELFLKWIDMYRPDYVAGLATTGGFLASQISLLSSYKKHPLKALYIRKAPKVNGLQKQIEGRFEGKSTAVIVDDAINSGNSAIEAIQLLSSFACVPVAFLTILNFEKKGVELLEKLKIPLHSLFSTRELGLVPQEKIEEPELYSLKWFAGFVSTGLNSDFPGASPVMGGKRVFINSDRSSLLSLEPNGHLDWSHNLDGPGIVDPLYKKGKVYFSSSCGNLYSALADSGKILWEQKIGTSCSYSSPVFSDDQSIILIGSEEDNDIGKLSAVNIENGQIIWEFFTEKRINSTPQVSRKYKTVITGCDDGTVYSLDMSGNLIWNFKLKCEVRTSVAIDDKTNSCYFGSNDGYIYSLDLSSGKLLWQRFISAIDYSEMKISGKRLVFATDSGFIFCLNKLDGTILWQRCLGIWKRPSFPEVFNNRVYIGSFEGNIMVFDLKNGSLLWKYSTGQTINSRPAVYSSYQINEFSIPQLKKKAFNIYNNKIYIMNEHGFTCIYNFEYNRLLWGFSNSEPELLKSALFVISSNGYVYCFGEN